MKPFLALSPPAPPQSLPDRRLKQKGCKSNFLSVMQARLKVKEANPGSQKQMILNAHGEKAGTDTVKKRGQTDYYYALAHFEKAGTDRLLLRIGPFCLDCLKVGVKPVIFREINPKIRSHQHPEWRARPDLERKHNSLLLLETKS